MNKIYNTFCSWGPEPWHACAYELGLGPSHAQQPRDSGWAWSQCRSELAHRRSWSFHLLITDVNSSESSVLTHELISQRDDLPPASTSVPSYKGDLVLESRGSEMGLISSSQCMWCVARGRWGFSHRILLSKCSQSCTFSSSLVQLVAVPDSLLKSSVKDGILPRVGLYQIKAAVTSSMFMWQRLLVH